MCPDEGTERPFNKAAGNKRNQPQQQPNPSEHELHQRLDTYGRIGNNDRDRAVFQRIKENYLREKQELEQPRIMAAIHYGQGVRIGLPHAPYQHLRAAYEVRDQDHRNIVLSKAKDYYRKNNSLTKGFDQAKAQPQQLRETIRKPREKGMDRE